MILFSQLPSITEGEIISLHKDREVDSILTDSRKGVASEGAVFFALKGNNHDGHAFLSAMYNNGIRQFVVESVPESFSHNHDINICRVRSGLKAIQDLARKHRSNFSIPVIGITGSNGKTIIKEWLYQLLSPDLKIAKNPGSYNSQLGVPLSVWQLQSHHQLGIFEAGISRPGEMGKLEQIIRPTIGIFSNLGTAHDEGFQSREEKLAEKLKLFSSADNLIYCRDHPDIHKRIVTLKGRGLGWGFHEKADIRIRKKESSFELFYEGRELNISVPFTDEASRENCFHCIATMLLLGYEERQISDRIKTLRSVPMRLELKEGMNQCQIIDDTYNNDLAGLQISLEFLSNQHQKKKKRLILSDIAESGVPDNELVRKISELVSKHGIQGFIGIGPVLSAFKDHFHGKADFFEMTELFLAHFDFSNFDQEIILVKGARSFQFERIVNRLQRKVHGTVMEIDLGAIADNLNFFRSRLKPSTRIMVMVKAFAYGSGSIEIANVLQYHRVDYLGVAYADEGIELRKNNISIPVMVMNPSEETFEALIRYNLEPEIYSFRILGLFLKFLDGRPARIHLKLDTGMHRLGFEKKDIPDLCQVLKKNPQVKVASIFSHLAASDESSHDDFSKMQAASFESMAEKLVEELNYRPLFHLLNSPGILRVPGYQYDMVRLGIGLYGINPTKENFQSLKPVATLKTIISQIKKIPAGETIGYGRKGVAAREMTLATIAIGYADGFSRAFSRGVGEVLVHGQKAKVVGNVCMDMTMVDITGIPAAEGDEVIIFGKDYPLYSLAERINTIPYELLTSTSERVKRVFVAESI